VSDVQTFIEVKQHPKAGPETPHSMCEKFENFFEKSIFDYFFYLFPWAPPHGLITDNLSECKIKIAPQLSVIF